jgi:hypothetical protein
MLVPYYNKKLQQLTFDKEMNFKIKSQQIRQIKNKLKELKAGKLIHI